MWLRFAAKSGDNQCLHSGLVATLGNFDGLHLGHQALIDQVLKYSKLQQLSSALITFSPHPAKVIRGAAPPRLTRLRQTIQLVKQKGVNELIIIPFNRQMALLEPERFISDILVAQYGVRHLVVGPFASIGRNRKGSSQWIVEYFSKIGLSASIAEPLLLNGVRVSSNLIRDCVAKGDLEQATTLLGRPFSIVSRVIAGDKRGRKLGFPTANLKISNYVKPPYGVYFCRAEINGNIFYALANFGVRPTFDGTEELLEAFLLDYKGPDLYSERVELSLLKKIRDERRFGTANELQQQIQADLETAKELIDKISLR